MYSISFCIKLTSNSWIWKIMLRKMKNRNFLRTELFFQWIEWARYSPVVQTQVVAVFSSRSENRFGSSVKRLTFACWVTQASSGLLPFINVPLFIHGITMRENSEARIRLSGWIQSESSTLSLLAAAIYYFNSVLSVVNHFLLNVRSTEMYSKFHVSKFWTASLTEQIQVSRANSANSEDANVANGREPLATHIAAP